MHKKNNSMKQYKEKKTMEVIVQFWSLKLAAGQVKFCLSHSFNRRLASMINQ